MTDKDGASEMLRQFLAYERNALTAVPQAEFATLQQAYRRLLPPKQSQPAVLAKPLPLLWIFGFDENGSVAGGPTANAAELKQRLKLLNYVCKFSHLPGQRAKAKNFAAFTGEGERLLATLRHLNYRHDKRDDGYWVTELGFWGMVLIVLLTPGARVALLRDFLDGGLNLPRQDEHHSILLGHAEAALPLAQPAEPEFIALIDRLSQAERARRTGSESMALAKALDLGLDGDDWVIGCAIPEAGGSGYLLSLSLRPMPEFDWSLGIIDSGNHSRFDERNGSVLRNDVGITPLGAGNLQAFPRWLKQAERELGVRFDLDASRFVTGRKRSAVARLRAWIEEV
ncbi:hypothetical protein [Bosea sp. (in: a-proteobacteria)]|jgi:hypothetical protein|uniref:hypothetical protein n=1 Tax=Bosea sp. (in: a-proteobacteria) TaxID=1871050 RepID=UPI003F71BA93